MKSTPFYRLDIQNNQVVRKRLSEFIDSIDARNLSDNVANIRKSLRGDRLRLIQTLQQLPPEPLDLGLVSRAEDVRVTNVSLDRKFIGPRFYSLFVLHGFCLM